jgi:hypothetical protein
MKDVLERCLKKTDVQVCTLTTVYILICNANYCTLATYVPPYDQKSLSLSRVQVVSV